MEVKAAVVAAKCEQAGGEYARRATAIISTAEKQRREGGKKRIWRHIFSFRSRAVAAVEVK